MAETWSSIELTRLLQAVYHYLPDGEEGSLQRQTKGDLRRVIDRLWRTGETHGCPTCGSTFYTFEESSEP